VLAAPMARLQQKTQAAVTTGTPNIPAFPARWFTAYTCSPRCAGLVSHRRPAKRLARLDPSVGGSGPHDFARPPRRRSSRSAIRVHRNPPHVSWRLAV